MSKFGKWWMKYNLFYLVLPLLFWGWIAISYKLCMLINTDAYTFDFPIDDAIPFYSYFFVFYFCYYFLPEIILWRLSCIDKKKYWRSAIAFFISCFIANLSFCIYNVQMIRTPGILEMKFSDIHNLSTFFDYCVHCVYKTDANALNCFPSMHAMGGALLVILGITIPKLDQKCFSLWKEITIVIIGIGCTLSTVFIKQHYFLDMIVGFLIMIILYALVTGISIIRDKNKENTLSIKE